MTQTGRTAHEAASGARGERGWARVETALAARLARVETEIRAYPVPIPACDAQYNHLLAQRRAIPREMERCRALAATGADPDEFLATCPYLDDAHAAGAGLDPGSRA